MIVIIGEFRVPTQSMAEAREAMARVITATRAEAGCLSYAYGEDVLDPGLFRVSEKWESRATVEAHFATPHMAEWKRTREALGFTGRDIRMYDAEGETAL